MNIITAFCLVLIVLAIGDIVSTKTKAFIPSVFVSAVIFLIGFWTIFPKDLVDLSSLGAPLAILSMYLLITHMGTMLNFKEFVRQWKTVIIAIGGIIGICVFTLTIGRLIFGWETVVVGTPPLTGGIVAAIMMSDAAKAIGAADLAVLAIVMYVMQGFVGYPITAYCLKKEGKRLLKPYRSGDVTFAKTLETVNGEELAATENENISREKFKIFPPLPEKYQTTYIYLAKLGVVALLANRIAALTNNIISEFVICLVLGVIAAELGFLERNILNISESFGLLMTSLMAYIFGELSQATPEMLAKILLPLAGIIVIGVTGMCIFSILLGKILGYSKEMSFAIALTSLYGFPPNYILTDEASKALSETPEERQFLMDQMLPKMLVGGFTTVTLASVIIGGIFVNFI